MSCPRPVVLAAIVLAALGVAPVAQAHSGRSAVQRELSQLQMASARPKGVLRAAGVVPNDPFWSSQWSAVRTRATRAWPITTGSARVVVAVLDTGVDATQPDLLGKLVPGYDFVNGDADPADDHGHGTAVAGIIGAVSNNRLGVTSYCWSCSIMPVKVLGADGAGYDTQVAAGVVWATDHGARIVNLSLGGPDRGETLAGAVAYAESRGVLVVAAAGNEGVDRPYYPAAFPGVVSVAATDSSDGLYPWSNRGSWVVLAAPGVNSTTGLGPRYVSFAGTSSATPVVAGIAGLAFSAVPSVTASEVMRALAASAAPVSGLSAGRVDAFGTLTQLGAVAPRTAKASRRIRRG